MGKSNLKKGTCHICRKETLLNYEHVPPRSTFNKDTRYKEAPFLDYMQSGKPFERELKGKVNQGGIGYHSYCEKCNNFLGNEYVRSYKTWGEIGMYILSKGNDLGHNYFVYEYEIREQKLNRILKQILSMFVAMNEEWFGNEHPEIIEFIKNPQSKDLPDRYKIFMYLNRGPEYRYISFMVQGNLKNGEIIKCCELAFPPYGYVLTIDSDKTFDYLADITHFKSFNAEEKVSRLMKIACLPTHLPIPLDYRTKEEIMKNIEDSDAANST